MKDIYELYKNSLICSKKQELEVIDNTIKELEAVLESEDWYLINGGFDGIEYVDGNDICKLSFIKNVGLFPLRKDKDEPTYAEIQAASFFIRNREIIERLSKALVKKQKMIIESAKDERNASSDIAKMLLSNDENTANNSKKIK